MKDQSFERSAGLLLNISSLPGKYAIGGFGSEARAFCSFLKNCGFRWWQTLPLTTIGLGNSPYSGISAFAGNPLYIDPEDLLGRGWVTQEEQTACICHAAAYCTDYAAAYRTKTALLENAFRRAKESVQKQLQQFKEENDWVLDYALFCAVKETDAREWWQWEDGLKFRKKNRLERFYKEQSARVEYYIFEQYVFDLQWRELRNFFKDQGICILGDMPIYVSRDSADVWAHPDLFQLDAALNPKKVAGVPPDYFSPEGQLWGNPIYDYDVMQALGFDWWVLRFKRMEQLYDALRIDHFRGLDQYWSVSPDAKNAVIGAWEKAPGAKLLFTVQKHLQSLKLVAEDLGTLDAGVGLLLQKTGLPGMRVMQFGFDEADSMHLPHRYSDKCFAYTGTHDNNTTFGWLYECPPEQRADVFLYTGFDPEKWGQKDYARKSVFSMIRTVFASSAQVAVLPVQDLLGYGKDCRMNTPGIAEGNWTFRLGMDALNAVDQPGYKKMLELFGRCALHT